MINIVITFKSGVTIPDMYHFTLLQPQISIQYAQCAVSSLSQQTGQQLHRQSFGLHLQLIMNHVIIFALQYILTVCVCHSVTRQSPKKYAYSSNWGHAVAQLVSATSRKVAGSTPDVVSGIFHGHNLSGRTMALGLTQPLTEMSTRNISWG